MHTDTIATVLANSNRPPEDIEASRRLFRVKARHDARRVISNYRSMDQFYSGVETLLWSLCNCEAQVSSVNAAITLLSRGVDGNQRRKGTAHYSGNVHMALRSRLVQARYLRRFGGL